MTFMPTPFDPVTVDAFYHAAIASNLAVAVWRAPADSAAQAVVDLSGSAHSAPIDFNAGQPAFVVAPFVNHDDQSALRIEADVHLTTNGIHQYRQAWNGQRQTLERFLVACHQPDRAAHRSWYLPATDSPPGRASTCEEYSQLVRSAIRFIAANRIEKVVVSRMTETPLPGGFDPMATFAQLCAAYPQAFVSLVAIPGVGAWLGASPELLLSIDSQGLRTVALAATQAGPEDGDLTAVRWSRKEIEEQALVSSYIRSFFRDAGVAAVRECGPETVQAGNVVHLQTRFDVHLPEPQMQLLATTMLTSLHPTSAVCGMPKDRALAFILANEGYDRSFYSGFLGPVNISGQTRLHVNLRCMQLRDSSASLFVGGGITAISNPEDEWRETQLKADTLLRVLHAADVERPLSDSRADKVTVTFGK